MTQKVCDNGHIYNAELYENCPYCSGNTNEKIFGSVHGGTAPVAGGFGPSDSVKTSIGKEYVSGNGAEKKNRTVAPSNYGKSQKSNRTVAYFEKKTGIQPVVGWIVCIKGTNQGKGYALYDKQNSIGRDPGNDVCVQGDNTISRDNHARIAYDVRHNAFTLIAKESINNIYLNDEPVYVPTKLSAYDKIEFGESLFLFVPFCNEHFAWTDVIKEKED